MYSISNAAAVRRVIAVFSEGWRRYDLTLIDIVIAPPPPRHLGTGLQAADVMAAAQETSLVVQFLESEDLFRELARADRDLVVVLEIG